MDRTEGLTETQYLRALLAFIWQTQFFFFFLSLVDRQVQSTYHSKTPLCESLRRVGDNDKDKTHSTCKPEWAVFENMNYVCPLYLIYMSTIILKQHM